MTYDDYLNQKAEEYNTGCQNYKCEIGREEHCKNCEHFCEEYLEDEDTEDLLDILMDLQEEIDTKYYNEKNVIALNNEIERRRNARQI